MKQIEVQIMQQSYLLSCPEGRELNLLEAVERIDSAMTRIRDAGKVRTRERIAVLGALNLAFEMGEREASALAALAQVQAAQQQAAQELATAALFNPPDAATYPQAMDTDDLQRLQLLVQHLDSALNEPSA
ncbi:cell division protein ZapA [Simplicispira psychrophila]|uniref:cell division protein ZapA n=1 Tax=Simplicispira psychrophila TaxID=80882 RepID=UPI0004859542|nr:cell division protein ZapA [Simplicispira psychrophila]